MMVYVVEEVNVLHSSSGNLYEIMRLFFIPNYIWWRSESWLKLQVGRDTLMVAIKRSNIPALEEGPKFENPMSEMAAAMYFIGNKEHPNLVELIE